MQLVDAVERRLLVAFGQRGIVENGVHEVIHVALQDHHGLADVEQLGSALADDVHAQNFARFAVEDQLQPAGGVAADLAARGFAIVGDAHFVGHVFVGQLLFVLADEGNFGNGVNAVRDRWPDWSGSSARRRWRRRCGPAPWKPKPGWGSRSRRPRRKCSGPWCGIRHPRRCGRGCRPPGRRRPGSARPRCPAGPRRRAARRRRCACCFSGWPPRRRRRSPRRWPPPRSAAW